MRRLCALLMVVTSAVVLPAVTRAQSHGVAASARFPQQPGRTRIGALDVSRTEKRWDWSLGLLYDFSKAPLSGSRAGLPGTHHLVDLRHRMELSILFGLPYFDIGLTVPIVAWQEGDDWTDPATGELRSGVRGFAMSDVRIHVKGMILNPKKHGLGIALGVDVTAPSGNSRAFAGARSAVFAPRFILDYTFGPADIAVLSFNFGYILRKKERVADLEIDDELFYGLGTIVRFGSLGLPVHIALEFVGSTHAFKPFQIEARSPLEARLTFRLWNARFFFSELGLGVGLINAVGFPRYHVFVNIGVSFSTPGLKRRRRSPPDRDGDGIADARDRCPTKAEDKDGFEDGDGCPEKGAPTPDPKDVAKVAPPKPPKWWQTWRKKRKTQAARRRVRERRQAARAAEKAEKKADKAERRAEKARKRAEKADLKARRAPRGSLSAKHLRKRADRLRDEADEFAREARLRRQRAQLLRKKSDRLKREAKKPPPRPPPR